MSLKYLPHLTILLLCSCSNWLEVVVTNKNNKDYSIKTRESQNYCEPKLENDFILAASNKKSHELFLSMIKNIKNRGISLKFVDELALWTLLQINIRPDRASIFSRLQILFNIDSKDYYFDFFDHKNKKTPSTIIGLNKILKYFNSDFNIVQIAELYEKNLLNQLTVDPELAQFLLEQDKVIRNFTSVKKYFFRGQQVLRNSERLPKISFVNIVKKAISQNSKDLRLIDKLYPIEYNKRESLSCNFDINLYKNDFVFIRKEKISSHLFTIAKKNQYALIATTISKPVLTNFLNHPFFISSEDSDNAAFCSYRKKNQNLLAFASDTRDNAQILERFISELSQKEFNSEELNATLLAPRSILLKDPVRIVLENDKFVPEKFISKRYPRYYSQSIGKIWTFMTGKNRHLAIDPRHFEPITCPKQ